MRVLQIINNNVITAIDDGKEVVVFEKGIGFQRKRGDLIEKNKDQKIFVPDKEKNEFTGSVSGIPFQILEIAKDIIDYGTRRFSLKIEDPAFFMLCDHLNFAIERLKDGVDIDNPFCYEIKTYFQDEYRTASLAIKRIKDTFDIDITDDEVCFIALHLIENTTNIITGKLKENFGMIDEIMKIIEEELGLKEEDKETYQYNRMLLHIKYFAGRYLSDKEVDRTNEELFNLVKEQFKKEYDCVQKISDHLYEKYKKAIKRSEVVYLTMHLKNCEVI